MTDSVGANTDTDQTVESDDHPDMYVVDPDDYQKTKQLEAIHNAKRRVMKIREDRPAIAKRKEMRGIRIKLAQAIADLGNELMPVIEDALDRGVLDENDLSLQNYDVMTFIYLDGRIPDHEANETRVAKPDESMLIYRQLNRIMRKLGLGLEFSEDQGPAEI